MTALCLTALGVYNSDVHLHLQMFSGVGSQEQSTLALQAGIRQWAENAIVPFVADIGFRVMTNGKDLICPLSNDQQIPVHGGLNMSVQL